VNVIRELAQLTSGTAQTIGTSAYAHTAKRIAKQGQHLSLRRLAHAPINIICALRIFYGEGNGFQGLFQGVPCHPAYPPILACSSLSLGDLTITL
jgi:hypothetical protein